MASGVVRTAGRASPPTRDSIVPIKPGRIPADSKIAWIRYAVVVFPFVPVTPATTSSSVGRSKNSSAATAIAARADGTISCGTERSSGRSATRAAAPRSTASSAKSCPSARSPGTQKKSAPGTTCRVSYARSAMSVGAPPRTSRGPSAAISRSRSIAAGG